MRWDQGVHQDIFMAICDAVTFTNEQWAAVMAVLHQKNYTFSESALRYCFLLLACPRLSAALHSSSYSLHVPLTGVVYSSPQNLSASTFTVAQCPFRKSTSLLSIVRIMSGGRKWDQAAHEAMLVGLIVAAKPNKVMIDEIKGHMDAMGHSYSASAITYFAVSCFS